MKLYHDRLYRILLMAVCMMPSILAKQSSSWRYYDFDVAMKTDQFPQAVATTKQIIDIDGNELLDFFRELYEEHNPLWRKPSSELKIPKIIHQIWLGSPLPAEFKEYIESWLEHHPGWKYKLWTDADVEKITLYNQRFYDASKNYGVKSDILKWEIIYRYGGVYIDMDFECLKPLDELHYLYDFYTALQPLDTQFVQLGAGIFAAAPNHPILKNCIETIKDDWSKKGAPTRTGPVHFTKAYYAVGKSCGGSAMVFPAQYFYPQGCTEKELAYERWIKEGAYGIHHWAKSWMPKRYRKKQFSSIENEDSAASWNDIGK